MTTRRNAYCAVLGIRAARVEDARSSPDANYYSLLLVALLELVYGRAPGWTDPWSRAQRAYVATDAWHSPSLLVDEQGFEIPRADIQLARLLDASRRAE